MKVVLMGQTEESLQRKESFYKVKTAQVCTRIGIAHGTSHDDHREPKCAYGKHAIPVCTLHFPFFPYANLFQFAYPIRLPDADFAFTYPP